MMIGSNPPRTAASSSVLGRVLVGLHTGGQHGPAGHAPGLPGAGDHDAEPEAGVGRAHRAEPAPAGRSPAGVEGDEHGQGGRGAHDADHRRRDPRHPRDADQPEVEEGAAPDGREEHHSTDRWGQDSTAAHAHELRAWLLGDEEVGGEVGLGLGGVGWHAAWVKTDVPSGAVPGPLGRVAEGVASGAVPGGVCA
jgi:hypothetical protein